MQTVKRLLSEFVPDNYNVSLTIDRSSEQFEAVVAIRGTSTNGNIAVHAKDLTIDSVLVDGKTASWASGIDDELDITLEGLAAGEHVVTIAYHADINDLTRGIYASRHKQDGVDKTMFVTQMEPDYARELVPCVDEPAAKATFDVTVTTAPGVTVLGNMPAKTTSEQDGQLVTTFETTPRMSSYLLALAVGELHSVTAKTARGVDVSVWATTAQDKAHLEFALEHAVKSIEFYEEFFGVDYPLPKSDQLALPDVSSGVAAMENWGLVTYREDSLVVDPKLTSIASRRRTAIVIAHELSHQWFGNLVTMEWWTYLWLNESFATVMEYLCMDAIHPEWNVWHQFAAYEDVVALRRDSLAGVQSVQIEVNHPDEIGSLFDGAIVYAKGSRLIRMLQGYCGVDAFRAGLKAYFTAHQYGNTTGDDLWDALSTATGKNVGAFMNAWVTQSGYPVVHATLKSDKLTLSQTQFFVGPHEPSDKLWPIPLGASDSSLPEILDTREATVDYTSTTPLQLNVGDTAHFITHYDDTLLARLLEQVKSGEMPVLGRMQLLHEQTLLARGGVVSSANLIALLDAYQHETHEGVWDMMSLALGELKKFVEDDKAAEQALRELADKLARPLYGKLGLEPAEGEDEETTQLRANVVGFMAYGEHEDTIRDITSLYERVGMQGLDPELRPLIMSVTVRHAVDASPIDSLLSLYPDTTAELQGDIAAAVTSTRQPDQIARLISLLTDTKVIRSQDTVHWYVDLIRNRDARRDTWQWCKDNWPWIMDTFGGEMNADAFLRYAASVITKREMYDDFVQFTTPLRSDISLVRSIDVGVVDIEGRIAAIERDGDAVRAALVNL